MWKLKDKDGNVIDATPEKPYHTKTFRGEDIAITGGRPPHKPGSTGRVFHKNIGGEYFPSVVDLEWIEED